ncbi:MAG TPA: Na-translocating system protein MpsC family protein [Phycisphaerales bacterium]|nr:Na-translocating system protein MpsC family protein [Phycisphaerales bacterium]
MNTFTPSMAEQVAEAAIAYQLERTGHAPSSATVVLSGDTLVITLHDALSEAERVLSQNPEGAARVQAFHRELFGVSAAPLRLEIERITGMPVREAAGEVEPVTGVVVHAFTSGTVVQVFQLAQGVRPAGAGNSAPSKK